MTLDETTVRELGAQQGFSIEQEYAARIAAGAANAVRAVVESRRGSLFDTEPSGFTAELERLADAE